MPYFETSQEWVEQSSLLLQAYPTSTIITTKYKIIPPGTSPNPRKRKATDSTTTTQTPTTSAQPQAPKSTLTLKSYDPVSGVCLKYRTDKAAEVGRLVASLGRLGRHMAALPEVVAEEVVQGGDGADVAEQKVDGKVDGAAQRVDVPAAMVGGQKVDGKGEGGAPPAAKKKKKGKK